MSRFYTKALLYPSTSEERFIFLWTVLEIFPMKDTANIKPISEYLSYYIQKDISLIKVKLSIGNIFGIRCDIVHYGKYDIFSKETGIYFDKLEAIVQEVIRSINGFHYDGGLDKYFS